MLGDLLHDRRETLRGIAGVALAAVGLSGTAAGRAAGRSAQGRGQGRCDVSVPDDYETIQDAVDAADEGDTVCVERGTYEESVTIDVEGLTLRSADYRAAVVDARAADGSAALYVDADGVTIEDFEIVGGEGTTSGVSIRTGNGATEDVTIDDNHIHGMAKPGGGGDFQLSSWGILAWGENTLSGVLIEDNLIEDIGGEPDALPAGAGIDLEEVEGSRRGEGALIRRNTIRNMTGATVDPEDFVDMNISIDGVPSVDIPGTGVAIQPTDGERSGAGDAATDVLHNDIFETSVDVVVGEVGLTRVRNNRGSPEEEDEDEDDGDDGSGRGRGDGSDGGRDDEKGKGE